MQNIVKRQTNLPAHVIQFCRYLRGHDFDVATNEEEDVLKALLLTMPTSITEQKNLYRSLLVKNRKQHLIFDRIYDEYWAELFQAENSKSKVETKAKNKPKQSNPTPLESLKELKNWLYSGKIDEEKEIATYSAFESLSTKDFSDFAYSEQQELQEIIKLIAQKLSNRYSRRYIRTNRHVQIDLRNTIKSSYRQGSEIQAFRFQEQKKKKVNIVLLCDVSRSMELYSRFLIQFMYGFQQVVHRLHTFVFSTALTPISPLLNDGQLETTIAQLSDVVPHWSGGTRIGAALDDFRSHYAHKLLSSSTIVIILSDGWDTGEIDLLERSIRSIKRKSEKVIWLNPLAGNTDYSPSARGMNACMPYIDIFASAHNISSLKQVTKYLKLKRFKPRFN